MTVSRKTKIAMLVVDANEVEGVSEPSRQSPVLHSAVHNLLDGLAGRDDIEVEVIYGRKQPAEGEDRYEGCLHYVPVTYKRIRIPGIGSNYLARLLAQMRHLSRTKPDVVHAQGVERESGLVAALSRRPSLLTMHGNFRAIAKSLNSKFPDYYWINSRMESFIVPRVDGVLCISNYTREQVKPLNPNTWLLPNPSVASYFQTTPKPVNGRIVCLGTIDARKNQLLLIEACDRLIARGIDFHVQFWGPIPSQRPYSNRFLEMIGQRPWASYEGNADIADIPRIIGSARVLVLPSLEDNCPMVVIEAMSLGVPVVATNVGGIPDLVSHGENGLLFDSNDLHELADAIYTVLSDETVAERLSRNGREIAMRRFHPDAVAAEHTRIYQQIHAPT